MTARSDRGVGYQGLMLGLCVYALAALGVQSFVSLDEETLAILDVVDVAVCLIFGLDFLRSLYRAPDRSRYLITWGWVDLLSSVPTVDWLRWGRGARAFRILRLLRGFRAARTLSTFALEYRAQSVLASMTLVALLAIVFGSVAVQQMEAAADSNLHSGPDALWWAFVTVTTVGYGDHYPVTQAGRLVAAALMVVGTGFFGTFTAFLATWLVDDEESDRDAQLARLTAELLWIRSRLEKTGDSGSPENS